MVVQDMDFATTHSMASLFGVGPLATREPSFCVFGFAEVRRIQEVRENQQEAHFKAAA